MVAFLGVSRDPNGKFCIVTELYPDGAVDSYLRYAIQHVKKRLIGSLCRRHDDISTESLVFMMTCAAAAVRYLHSLGIVHRDLGLRNYLVDKGGKGGMYLL